MLVGRLKATLGQVGSIGGMVMSFYFWAKLHFSSV